MAVAAGIHVAVVAEHCTNGRSRARSSSPWPRGRRCSRSCSSAARAAHAARLDLVDRRCRRRLRVEPDDRTSLRSGRSRRGHGAGSQAGARGRRARQRGSDLPRGVGATAEPVGALDLAALGAELAMIAVLVYLLPMRHRALDEQRHPGVRSGDVGPAHDGGAELTLADVTAHLRDARQQRKSGARRDGTESFARSRRSRSSSWRSPWRWSHRRRTGPGRLEQHGADVPRR